ncbi:MAG: RNA methyltransferase [Burkholderiaceae bacterium]
MKVGDPGAPAPLFSRHDRLVRFVLVEPSHPGNVGAAARAMAVMGFSRLCLVAPKVAGAAFHGEARALASGANHVLVASETVGSFEAAVAEARLVIGFSAGGREFAAEPVTPESMAASVLRCLDENADGDGARAAPVALVFGTERTGLPIALAQKCHLLCRIPANPAYSSLNLAQALQVIAYVLRQAINAAPAAALPVPRADQAPVRRDDRAATHAQLEGLHAHLESVLIEIGFLDPDKPRRLMPRLRRLFTRSGLSLKEVDILRGICARIEAVVREKP